MLVLTRRAEPGKDTVFIDVNGTTIEIKVVDVTRDACRIGLTAPKEVIIRRGELPSDEQKS